MQTASDWVVIDTAYGSITAEIFTAQAPITAKNFLRYIDESCYSKASFYRSARTDNDSHSPKINILQGGMDPTCRAAPFPSIPHESTEASGLRHEEGTLSAVRWDPGSATSEFFVVLSDAPELDFGGGRNPDGQGFAAFGRVRSGIEILRTIHQLPTVDHPTIDFMKNQALVPPVGMCIARLK